MSRILWSQVLQPTFDERPGPITYGIYDAEFCVPHAIALGYADEQIVVLPDPRAARSLSRAGLMLNAVGLQSKAVLAPFLSKDTFSVGVYCSMEWGPNDFNSAKQMIHTSPEKFAATYKALRSAKQYLKMIPSVPASQLAIFLEVNGPLNVYTHSQFASAHALDQAEFDLNYGNVAAALVCSAFSLEDPLISMRTWRNAPPQTTLCEAAGCLLLTADGTYTKWGSSVKSCGERYYGIAHQIVMAATVKERPKNETGLSFGTLEPISSGHVPHSIESDAGSV